MEGGKGLPNAVDRALGEADGDKFRKYRADYNKNPPNFVSFMPVSTSGRLHSEFVRLLVVVQLFIGTQNRLVALHSALVLGSRRDGQQPAQCNLSIH